MMNEGSTYEGNVSARKDISITKLGLKVPSEATSYEDFKSIIKTSESILVKSIR